MTNGDKGQAGGVDKKPREPERYPTVRQDDAIEPENPLPSTERRSFDPAHEAPPSIDEGRLGPRGDPAEGKR